MQLTPNHWSLSESQMLQATKNKNEKIPLKISRVIGIALIYEFSPKPPEFL